MKNSKNPNIIAYHIDNMNAHIEELAARFVEVNDFSEEKKVLRDRIAEMAKHRDALRKIFDKIS